MRMSIMVMGMTIPIRKSQKDVNNNDAEDDGDNY